MDAILQKMCGLWKQMENISYIQIPEEISCIRGKIIIQGFPQNKN